MHWWSGFDGAVSRMGLETVIGYDSGRPLLQCSPEVDRDSAEVISNDGTLILDPGTVLAALVLKVPTHSLPLLAVLLGNRVDEFASVWVEDLQAVISSVGDAIDPDHLSHVFQASSGYNSDGDFVAVTQPDEDVLHLCRHEGDFRLRGDRGQRSVVVQEEGYFSRVSDVFTEEFIEVVRCHGTQGLRCHRVISPFREVKAPHRLKGWRICQFMNY